MNASLLPLDDYIEGVLQGDVSVLARAITLVESERRDHRTLALKLLTALWPKAGQALRIGISGVPGAGKSTLIDRLGVTLCSGGHRVAVLAIDPSSAITGGSVLGDKTRMLTLSRDPRAFVRPSPTRGVLGGVASRTQEAMVLCEAAGYDVLLIETIGVGQSEAVVAEMVDRLVVLALTGAGDQLQGIKRGILEVVDLLVVHKADGDNEVRARDAARDYETALRLLRGSGEAPDVLTASAQTGRGIDEICDALWAQQRRDSSNGTLAIKRASQLERWMWRIVDDEVRRRVREQPQVAAALGTVEEQLSQGQLLPTLAAERLLDIAFRRSGDE